MTTRDVQHGVSRFGRITGYLRNVLFVALVVVLLTGGGRFKGQLAGVKIYLDLANVGGMAAYFFALLLLGAWRPGRDALREEWWYRQTWRYYGTLAHWLKRRPVATALVLGAAFAAVVGTGAVARHLTFGSHAYDLGVMYEPLWKTLHGHFHYSVLAGEVSGFAIHIQPIFFLLLPFLALWESPVTLLIIQTVALALAIVPLTLLARRLLRSEVLQVAVLIAFVSYFPYRHIGLWDYHHVVLAVPLLLAALVALEQERWRWFAAFLGLALFTKETVALPVFCFGIALVMHKRRRVGALVAAAAAVYFVLVVHFVPHWLGVEKLAMDQFDYLGDSTVAILLSPIQRPAVFWGELLNRHTLLYVWQLLGPLGFLPVLAPWMLLPVVPVFAYLALSGGTNKLTIEHHDISLVLPFVYYALILGLARVEAWLAVGEIEAPRWWKSRTAVAVLLVVASLLFYGKSDLYRMRSYRMTPHKKHVRMLIEQFIPPDAGVAANTCIVPHLLNRQKVYLIPRQPPTVQYIFFDTKLPYCRWPMSLEEKKNFPASVNESRFERIYDDRGVIIWRQRRSAMELYQ
ncbi:MAG: DUF2079 domain-containing protein [Candidatus Lernaella stagnicola]|nr:DUF2079 domain-containing protein [Candidatus Lernaella stagnicola]